jgi:hypothetical protein
VDTEARIINPLLEAGGESHLLYNADLFEWHDERRSMVKCRKIRSIKAKVFKIKLHIKMS